MNRLKITKPGAVLEEVMKEGTQKKKTEKSLREGRGFPKEKGMEGNLITSYRIYVKVGREGGKTKKGRK